MIKHPSIVHGGLLPPPPHPPTPIPNIAYLAPFFQPPPSPHPAVLSLYINIKKLLRNSDKSFQVHNTLLQSVHIHTHVFRPAQDSSVQLGLYLYSNILTYPSLKMLIVFLIGFRMNAPTPHK